MNGLKTYLTAVILTALLISAPVLAAENLVIKGSTTVLPIAQAAGEAFVKKNPTMNVSISGGGSGDGIKALLDRTTDIADSSRDIKPEETQLAESKGVKPKAHGIAIDAIVPIVNPANKVADLTIEQLSLIYQGKIENWKELGGADKKISVISRDTSSGTYESWENKVLHKAKVTAKAQLQASNGAIVQVVSKNKYAIGYIGIGYLNKTVKGLKVNGIEANSETATSGKYPISRPLYMFTNGEPSGPAAKFITFVLSAEGQGIVKKEGFVPIKK